MMIRLFDVNIKKVSYFLLDFLLIASLLFIPSGLLDESACLLAFCLFLVCVFWEMTTLKPRFSQVGEPLIQVFLNCMTCVIKWTSNVFGMKRKAVAEVKSVKNSTEVIMIRNWFGNIPVKYSPIPVDEFLRVIQSHLQAINDQIHSYDMSRRLPDGYAIAPVLYFLVLQESFGLNVKLKQFVTFFCSVKEEQERLYRTFNNTLNSITNLHKKQNLNAEILKPDEQRTLQIYDQKKVSILESLRSSLDFLLVKFS